MRVNVSGLTCTLGSGDESRSRLSGSPLSWSGQQHSDLILRVGIQVPQLVIGRVDGVGLCPASRCHPVLHLLQDDGAVPEYGVSV